MAKWLMDSTGGPLDYPTLGFVAEPGDILDATAAPDARWSLNANQAAAETVYRYTLGSNPDYVEPTNGHVLTWSATQNRYVPTAPETVGLPSLSAYVANLDSNPASAVRVQQDARLSATYARVIEGPLSPFARGLTEAMRGSTADATAVRTALQNTINDAGIAGSEALLPDGNWFTDAALVLRSGAHINSNGRASIKGTANHDIINDGGVAVSGASVRNLYLEVAGASTAGSGIELTGCADVTIDGCKVVNAWDAIDILTGSIDVFVTGNIINGARQQGIQSVASSRVKVQGNIINGVGTTNLHHCIYIAGGTDIDVSGNIPKGAAGFGVHVYASSGAPARINVANNTITDTGNGPSGTRGGIYVGGTVTMTDVAVSGNVIHDAGGGVGFGAANVLGLAVTGNTIRLCGEHGMQIESTIGLSTRFTVTGNDVSGYNQNGVGASGLRVPIAGSIGGGVVVGNQFRNPSAIGGPASIYSSGSADYMIVTGNDLRGGGSLALAGVNNVSASNLGP